MAAAVLPMPAWAREGGWRMSEVKVYPDTLTETEGRTCVALTLSQDAAGRVLGAALGVVRQANGDAYLKATVDVLSGPDYSLHARPDAVDITDAAGHSTAGHGRGTDKSDNGMTLFFYALDDETWAIADAAGRDGRYTVRFRLPDGAWDTADIDLTQGHTSDDANALSRTPAGNPRAFADCVAGLGIRR